jgi:putative ABC transport system ATP-binding protein
MALCAGLDRPTEGEIYVAGQALGDLSEDELATLRRNTIGFIFQSFHLIPTLTALENVMVPRELQLGKSSKAIEEEAAALLSRLGLGARLTHLPSQLSGGEQQRVAIARAFIGHPKLLFADEPTGNLDGQNARTAIDLIHSLTDEYRTAVLFVTHDQELAASLPRVVALKDGQMQ